MSNATREVPPALKLLCLKALWRLREGNVKEVQRVVAESRPLAYTTIMTVLDRLVRKGRLDRRKVGRLFVYSPMATRDALRHAAVRELVESLFDGSEAELVSFLGGANSEAAAVDVPAAAARETDRIDTVLL